MRLITIAFVATCVLGAAGTAAASVSDVEYLKANRCRGLAAGELASVDTTALDAFLKAEKRSRAAYIVDRGRTEMEKAKGETKTQNEERKARLTAELTGPCQVYKG
ncbi:hypothetical protein [Phenylobacterium sp.]|uniref:hypothetical protein n=1 Tax=Phenylobacterium sp. TaxID=1871053 RepID=UPI002736BC31|nr:hypothetical protein [Phenylobacterium sp.]MDP3854892.1 hypothetical protein [Phenylobacterium sp.]